jgi:hypothetical protein
VETHLFKDAAGAKKFYDYLQTVRNKQSSVLQAQAVGDESLVAYLTSGKIQGSTVDRAIHQVYFRRGNLVGVVKTIGAAPFMKPGTTAAAKMMDDKALGSRPAPSPTPTSTTPPANQAATKTVGTPAPGAATAEMSARPAPAFRSKDQYARDRRRRAIAAVGGACRAVLIAGRLFFLLRDERRPTGQIGDSGLSGRPRSAFAEPGQDAGFAVPVLDGPASRFVQAGRLPRTTRYCRRTFSMSPLQFATVGRAFDTQEQGENLLTSGAGTATRRCMSRAGGWPKWSAGSTT